MKDGMEESNITKFDRVRRNSPKKLNQQFDQEIKNAVALFKGKDENEISRRIKQLEKEWSIERNIETFASSLILSGVVLSAFINKRWLVLPGIVAVFLLQHGIQGWCPPVPLFRALKTRTRKEIDWENFSLKVLRGDFDNLSKANAKQVFKAVRKL